MLPKHSPRHMQGMTYKDKEKGDVGILCWGHPQSPQLPGRWSLLWMPEIAAPILRARLSSSHPGLEVFSSSSTQAHDEETAKLVSYFRCLRGEDKIPLTQDSSAYLLGGTKGRWMDGWMETSRWTNGWVNREMDGWLEGDKHIDKWMDGQMDRWMDKQMDGWMDWRIDGKADGQMDRWMDRQADGQMDGCLTYQPHPLSLTKSSGLNPSAMLKDRLKGDWNIISKVIQGLNWTSPKGSFVLTSSFYGA